MPGIGVEILDVASLFYKSTLLAASLAQYPFYLYKRVGDLATP